MLGGFWVWGRGDVRFSGQRSAGRGRRRRQECSMLLFWERVWGGVLRKGSLRGAVGRRPCQGVTLNAGTAGTASCTPAAARRQPPQRTPQAPPPQKESGPHLICSLIAASHLGEKLTRANDCSASLVLSTVASSPWTCGGGVGWRVGGAGWRHGVSSELAAGARGAGRRQGALWPRRDGRLQAAAAVAPAAARGAPRWAPPLAVSIRGGDDGRRQRRRRRPVRTPPPPAGRAPARAPAPPGRARHICARSHAPYAARGRRTEENGWKTTPVSWSTAPAARTRCPLRFGSG
jgi:hypothetical protein